MTPRKILKNNEMIYIEINPNLLVLKNSGIFLNYDYHSKKKIRMRMKPFKAF